METDMEANAAKGGSSLDVLKRDVIEAGLCVACGACAGLCPHLFFYKGRVVAPDACDLENGRCLRLCPVNQGFSVEDSGKDGGIGPVVEAWQAKSAAGRKAPGAQYGGVASALVSLALERGLAREAMLTKTGEDGAPRGFLAAAPEQAASAAGSVYAAGGGLEALNLALASGRGQKTMAVALPCQARAIAAMKLDPDYAAAGQNLGLVIGLFCTWNMSAESLALLLKEQNLEGRVDRMDIPPPPAEVFELSVGGVTRQIPLARVRELTMPGCGLCQDMTAESADISVGAVEGRPGWNTVLVRGQKGKELFEIAQKDGWLEVEPVDRESLMHLKLAAAGKRKRALAAGRK